MPKTNWETANTRYLEQRNQPGFELFEFVLDAFDIPHVYASDYKANREGSVEEHIEGLWSYLTRSPEPDQGSLMALPYPYIVPGGRFGEIYYWDSYFTMLGLAVSGRVDMIRHMVNNFAHLIREVGFIPNGNRTYYLSRSQPPFFSLMVELLMKVAGEDLLLQYARELETEYDWWMGDSQSVVSLRSPQGSTCCLNRYWDLLAQPRPEAWREDAELAAGSADSAAMYRHLRAGAASGWDFSSRWFAINNEFSSIETTAIIPVDLNCLLWNLEGLLAKACRQKGDSAGETQWLLKQKQRQELIQFYCWNEETGFFHDYQFIRGQQTSCLTLAGMFPLWMGMASSEQALRVAQHLSEKFLQPGGLMTTLCWTQQQWDAPNGWAPLQYISIRGLERNGFHQLASEIALRWISLNRDVFHRTGKMMEKYNVVNTELEAGGGEYTGQDGFGWTNGVFLALANEYAF